MQYCMSHPEEMSKLSKLKAQITEVKGIMMDNIEKVCFCSFADKIISNCFSPNRSFISLYLVRYNVC